MNVAGDDAGDFLVGSLADDLYVVFGAGLHQRFLDAVRHHQHRGEDENHQCDTGYGDRCG